MTLPDLLRNAPSQAGELCAWCQQPSKHQCAGCEAVTYCSGEHQKEHWHQHRDECNAYRVLINDSVGRYGVATRTLEPGEQILIEPPVVLGPKPDSYIMCLGCYARLDGSTLCSRCRWPVCGPKCEAAPCHAKAECPVFESARVRFQSMENYKDPCPQLNCVAPLRLLLVKESNPERWESELKFMQTHNKERRQTPIWENNQINVVEYLRRACKLADRFDEDLIHTACGILEINTFEVPCPSGSTVQGLYARTAVMSHSCVPNTSHCIINSDGNRLILRTTMKIEKGSEIYTAYTHTMNPTLLRRDHLQQSKFFDCKCARCSDPTELGTNMSSMKCNQCDSGFIMSSDPLHSLAQWKCTHCEYWTPGIAVKRTFSVIQSDLDRLDYAETCVEAVEKCEELCRKYRPILHPNHAFLMNLRCSLSHLYGHARGYSLEELPDILLERKIEICKHILSVAEIIEPGLSRLRGLTLYELHTAAVLFARNQLRYKEIDDKKLRVKLEEAEKYLTEAVHILKFEHPSSPEGLIAAIGEKSLHQLRESIESLPKS